MINMMRTRIKMKKEKNLEYVFNFYDVEELNRFIAENDVEKIIVEF
jgi:hypothetical protein